MNTVNGLSQKLLLVVLDGFGINETSTKNAIRDAKKPNLDYLFSKFPYTTIEAGGELVGLPKGVRGNSEVGHMNLGAGRAVRQDLIRINEAIENDTLAEMEKFQELVSVTKSNSNRVHLMGLLSDGGVHSHIDHLKILIKKLSSQGLEVYFHAFMDGRDTPRNKGHEYIKELNEIKGFKFASMQGRSIGMDRDRRWNKIKLAQDTMTGHGSITEQTPLDYINDQYSKDIFDEFIEPTLFSKDYAIEENDSIFFINFRPDRAVQISLAFNDKDFKEYERKFLAKYFLCMTPYIPDEVELPILFDKEPLSNTCSEILSDLGYKQLKIAETEKYAHVTFFFNGGSKKPFKNENQILIPSPKEVSTYDQKPEMAARDVTERLMAEMENDYKFILVNFANSDMVGHTGNYEAAVKAIEVLDECIGKLTKRCEELNYTMLLTADHGNSDEMEHADGSPHTAHSKAPVPVCLYDSKIIERDQIKINGDNFSLKDISPTTFYLLGLDKPKSFEGNSIFK